jgi:uncharacterized protein YegJ (DUF2314 family)
MENQTVVFVDAQEMARLNPDTFEAPNKEELDAITEGDSVKICNSQERFWVTVASVDGDYITATVDNHLLDTSDGLELGNTVKFTKSNIYDIW